MKRQNVDSSMATSVGYESETSTLEIEFKTGEVWQYYDVPENVFNEMMRGLLEDTFKQILRINIAKIELVRPSQRADCFIFLFDKTSTSK